MRDTDSAVVLYPYNNCDGFTLKVFLSLIKHSFGAIVGSEKEQLIIPERFCVPYLITILYHFVWCVALIMIKL